MSAKISTRRCPAYELSFGDAMTDGTIPSSRNIVQEEFEFLSCCMRIGDIVERLVSKEDRHAHTYQTVGLIKVNCRDEVQCTCGIPCCIIRHQREGARLFDGKNAIEY
jgi:hypothetical protein